MCCTNDADDISPVSWKQKPYSCNLRTANVLTDSTKNTSNAHNAHCTIIMNRNVLFLLKPVIVSGKSNQQQSLNFNYRSTRSTYYLPKNQFSAHQQS